MLLGVVLILLSTITSNLEGFSHLHEDFTFFTMLLSQKIFTFLF